MHGADPPALPFKVDVIGVTSESGEQHEHDPDADGRGGGGALSGEVEDESDHVRADRDIRDRGMERVTEPDSVEEILDDRYRLVERGEDRDEDLAEWIGPHGLRFQDPLDRVVKHGGSLRGLSD